MTVAQVRQDLLNRFGANGDPVMPQSLGRLLKESSFARLLWEELNRAGGRSISKFQGKWPRDIDEVAVLSDEECREFQVKIEVLTQQALLLTAVTTCVH